MRRWVTEMRRQLTGCAAEVTSFAAPAPRDRCGSGRRSGDPPATRPAYSPLYAWRPVNQSEPEYVTSTIPKPTTSSSAAGRPAHRRWLRAWR